MWVEIDKQVAVKCLNLGSPIAVEPYKTESGEFCFKSYFKVLGCHWLIINNYVSAVTQYYIEDINA